MSSDTERKIAERLGIAYEAVKYRLDADPITRATRDALVAAEERIAKLETTLREADDLLVQHHEIGVIQRSAEKVGRTCELCCNGVFKRIRAALRKDNKETV